MRRFLVTALFAIGLAACTPATIEGGGPAPPGASAIDTAPPAPLASTQVDDKALILAWKSFDATLYAIDALIAAKVIVPGSPKALKIAEAAEGVRRWLNAATEAQRLGQSRTYDAALAQAEAAFIAFRAALE